MKNWKEYKYIKLVQKQLRALNAYQWIAINITRILNQEFSWPIYTNGPFTM